MKKNINLKIVIMFFVVGLILIIGLGVSYLLMLNQLETIGNNQENIELIESIQSQLLQTKIIVIISIVGYTIISILIGVYVVKSLVSPMKKLIKSAEKIAYGENVKLEDNIQNLGNAGDVGDLENAFSIVTNELNQKLSEVNRQKRQIETILLHMTDGIIAFNMDGSIIHINPAAKTLLDLNDKDNTLKKYLKN